VHVRIRRRRWLIVALTIAVLTVAAAVSIATRIPITSNAMRTRVVAALEDRLDADVELADLRLRIYPRLHATGEGLIIRFHHRQDLPPLVKIARLSIDADLVGLWRHRVARVGLDGLEINIPPGDERDADPDAPPAVGTAGDPRTQPDGGDAQADDEAQSYASGFIIEEVDAPEAQLTILRSDPDKEPRVWYLHRLKLRDVGLSGAMPFDTFLTNAVPPGQIAATGRFGPWRRRAPGATPLEGAFTFENADLSVFKGISGVLHAKGTFGGRLDRISVDGQTETPDFMVNLSHHPVPLTTTYHAIVDGTNGNTTLEPVEARVLNTTITAAGGVYEVEGVKGRVVRLDVGIEDGRLEDVLRMAVPTDKPTMLGGLQLHTSMTIPPGPQDVVDKLQLDGRFAIERGRFTDPGVQQKINELSQRARGRSSENVAQAGRVESDFAGQFRLQKGRLALRTLTFDVPGAVVSLDGAYHLERGTLAFTGDLYMDARISQTVKGWKSWLLKMADPIFRHDGKTVVPLKISGSRNDPKFGLDVKRVFRR